MSYNALVDYAASGTTYAINFPYLDTTTVVAEVGGVEDVARTISGGNVVLSYTPTPGTTVRIRRRTPISYIGSYSPGVSTPAQERTNALLAVWYHIEEQSDINALAFQMIGNLSTISTDAIQDFTSIGGVEFALTYNVLPTQIQVFVDGAPVQLGDATLLGALGDTPTLAWGLWYDTINDLTILKFSETIPTGTLVRVQYRSTT